MVLANESLDVQLADDGLLRCEPCAKLLKQKHIAMLTRREPGGVFHPMCVECAHQVIRAAMNTLAIEDALEQLYN